MRSVKGMPTGERPTGPWRHVIWDWNGTIVNDVLLSVELIGFQTGRRGLGAVSLERYRDLIVFPIRDFYVNLGFNLELESFEALNFEFVDAYQKRRFECGLHEGVPDLIAKLAASGIGSSILSAYEQSALDEAVGHYGLRDSFRIVKGLGHTLADDKAAAGEELAGMLPYPRSELLVVGDTTHDAHVARSLGAGCVLFEKGHQSRRKLDSCGFPVVESAAELRNIIFPSAV